MCGAPTTPFISNLPAGGSFGGSFLAVVTTNGDGMKFVTSGSTGVCTVGPDGLTVHFVGLGACSLTAHVTAGATFPQADGNPQSFTVGRAVPTIPQITNLPADARVGGFFEAAVSTTGDGIRFVTSSTPGTCIAVGLTVISIRAGSCVLTAHVSAGPYFVAATGNAQSYTVNNLLGRLSPV